MSSKKGPKIIKKSYEPSFMIKFEDKVEKPMLQVWSFYTRNCNELQTSDCIN